MLGHELAHLKRHDLAWNWLPTVVGWLFFFHPLVWFMTRRWSEAQEAACDELLIQAEVARPVPYGRLLLETFHALATSAAHFDGIGRRIGGLSQPATQNPGTDPRASVFPPPHGAGRVRALAGRDDRRRSLAAHRQEPGKGAPPPAEVARPG